MEISHRYRIPTIGRALGVAGLVAVLVAQACTAFGDPPETVPLEPIVHADRPYTVPFAPRRCRFVRIVVHRSSGNQPCLDEVEVYESEGAENLALSQGARATASSCLPGYSIHQVAHLNDGLYGNAHSWIAAGSNTEWAQIELPGDFLVAKVVISRDRAGKYHDRVPVDFEVRLSLDGQDWTTVRHVQAAPAVRPAKQTGYSGRFSLSATPTWDELLSYAFGCERDTWQRMSAQDHLSPLKTNRSALPGGPEYWSRIARLDSLTRTLYQMEEMANRLAEKGLDVTDERRQLANLRARQTDQSVASDMAGSDDANRDSDRLYRDARLAKRRLMFRDPALEALTQLLFVKRHPYHASHNYSEILDAEFRQGGGICRLEIPRRDGRLDPSSARLRLLFDGSHGIARDPAASFDAQHVYYAYRPSSSPVEGWKPYWHLMRVDSDGRNARQLTDGPYHDSYPCPLPDGGLAFISTRVRARFLCWRPQAFVLFRMDGNGSNIRPLSFANISEWSPSVMRDGRILWTRSEYIDKGADFGHTLWAVRPDGTHPQLIFGNDTPNCYINGREVPGTDEICCTLFSHGGDHNGPIGLVDRAHGPFDSAAVTNITPDVSPHYNMSWPRYECFRDPTPIDRDYFLVSHAPADRFGLYVIDRYGNRELLYMDPAIGSMCPTPLRPVARPPILPSSLDSTLAQAGLGRMTLADVYRGLGPDVSRGQAKYLRVCEEVRAELIELPNGQCRDDHQPFQDWYATPIHKVSGPNGWPSYVAKASLGLIPIEPDGSATFDVPAGKTLYFEVLDDQFNELQRMRSVVQLQAGETRSCIGCHESRSQTFSRQHRVAASGTPAVYSPPPWGIEPFSYERIVQPIWDAHCLECHHADDDRGLNLSAKPDRDKIPASYRSLISGGWVHYFDCTYGLQHHKAEPKSFGTLKSKLWDTLNEPHHGVRLTVDEMRAVKCWIDLNCPLWPDYRFRPDR